MEEDEVSSKVKDNSVKDVTGQVEKETVKQFVFKCFCRCRVTH